MDGRRIQEIDQSRDTDKSYKLQEDAILVARLCLCPIVLLSLDIGDEVERHCGYHIDEEFAALDVSQPDRAVSDFGFTVNIAIIWQAHEVEDNVKSEEECAQILHPVAKRVLEREIEGCVVGREEATVRDNDHHKGIECAKQTISWMQ